MRTREELMAQAALLGMDYDWYDHTMNKGNRMYDPETMELLADENLAPEKYNRIVKERMDHYEKVGRSRYAQKPHYWQDGQGYPQGNQS